MTITTEFVLRSPSLPLVSITEILQPDEIECIHALCLQSDVQMCTVQFDHDDDVSEEDLLALNEVVETNSLGETSDKTVYKLTIELEEPVSQAMLWAHISPICERHQKRRVSLAGSSDGSLMNAKRCSSTRHPATLILSNAFTNVE